MFQLTVMYKKYFPVKILLKFKMILIPLQLHRFVGYFLDFLKIILES